MRHRCAQSKGNTGSEERLLLGCNTLDLAHTEHTDMDGDFMRVVPEAAWHEILMISSLDVNSIACFSFTAKTPTV